MESNTQTVPDPIEVSAAEVRSWARNRGLSVGTRGHLSNEVSDEFNRRHRRKVFVNRNPSSVRSFTS